MNLASFGIDLGHASQAIKDNARQADADALGALRAEDAYRAEQDRQTSLAADKANPLTSQYGMPAAKPFTNAPAQAPVAPAAAGTAAPAAYSPTGATASPWAGRTAQRATDFPYQIGQEQAKLNALRAKPAETDTFTDPMGTVTGGFSHNTDIADSEGRLKQLRADQQASMRGSASSSAAPASKEAFINAIYGQESNSGKADTSKRNYAGAIGPMQMTEATFKGMKRLGQIPQDANFENPADSENAGRIHAGYLYDKYQGDTQKAAAAYYTGESNVAKGNYLDNIDKKNSKAPTVRRYVDEIHARLGAAPGAPAAPGTPAAPGAPAAAAATAEPVSSMDFLAQAKAAVDPLVARAQQHMKLLEARFNGTSNLQTRDAIRAEYDKARAGEYDGQLISLGYSAGAGNQQALGQLVQVFATKTQSDVGASMVGPNQYVLTQAGPDGKRVSVTKPMSGADLAQQLLQSVSPSIQARAAARAETEGDARAKSAGTENGKFATTAALEAQKSKHAQELELIKGSTALDLELQKYNLSKGDVTVTGNLTDGVIVTRKQGGQVGVLRPAKVMNGVAVDAGIDWTPAPAAGLRVPK